MSNIEPFVGRMIKEYQELSERLKKLIAFTKTDKFAALDEGQRNLLEEQREAMSHYKKVLGQRIDINGGFLED